jgi:hypothetical protein
MTNAIQNYFISEITYCYYQSILEISHCCLYRAYLSSYYLQTDPTLCKYHGSKIVIQSRHFHQGLLAATTVIRDFQLHEQNTAIDSCLHCHAYTIRFIVHDNIDSCQ